MIKRVLCFENPARLSLKLAQIVVELQDVTRTLPIEDIGVVILDHKQITRTSKSNDVSHSSNRPKCAEMFIQRSKKNYIPRLVSEQWRIQQQVVYVIQKVR